MILVTGGTGLLGAHLLYELVSHGQAVRAIKRGTSDLKHVENLFCFYSSDGKNLFSKIEWVEGDILDIFSIEDALEGIDKVYHCAAIVSFRQSELALINKLNSEGTANVVNACYKDHDVNLPEIIEAD